MKPAPRPISVAKGRATVVAVVDEAVVVGTEVPAGKTDFSIINFQEYTRARFGGLSLLVQPSWNRPYDLHVLFQNTHRVIPDLSSCRYPKLILSTVSMSPVCKILSKLTSWAIPETS